MWYSFIPEGGFNLLLLALKKKKKNCSWVFKRCPVMSNKCKIWFFILKIIDNGNSTCPTHNKDFHQVSLLSYSFSSHWCLLFRNAFYLELNTSGTWRIYYLPNRPVQYSVTCTVKRKCLLSDINSSSFLSWPHHWNSLSSVRLRGPLVSLIFYFCSC